MRWITEQLGTAAFGDAAIPSGAHVIDVRTLVDRGGNLAAAVRGPIVEGIEALAAGETVVVCCDYGISRSNAVAAGVLACRLGVSLDDAVRRVSESAHGVEIKLDVLASVRAVTDALGAPPSVTASGGAGTSVIVTGASGFVGRALMPLLGIEKRAVALAHCKADLLSSSTELDRAIRAHGATSVVHLASPRVYTSNTAIGQMVTMLRNVLDACATTGARLIFVSSWEVFSGYRSLGWAADEHLVPRPRGPYGEAKVLCEQLIALHSSWSGVKSLVVRAAPMYGPGGDRPRFLYGFLRKACQNDPIVTHTYRNGSPTLDLLFVDDFARFMVAAVASDSQGIVHVGTGVGTSTTEVAEWIVRLTGSASHIQPVQIDAEAPNVRMDSAQARHLFGWQPRVDLDTGLRKTLEVVSDGHK